MFSSSQNIAFCVSVIGVSEFSSSPHNIALLVSVRGVSEFSSSPQDIALLVSVRGVSEFSSSPQNIALFVSVTGVSEFSSPHNIALLVSVTGVSSSFMKLGFTIGDMFLCFAIIGVCKLSLHRTLFHTSPVCRLSPLHRQDAVLLITSL